MTPGVIRNGATGRDASPSPSGSGNVDRCGVQFITLDRSAELPVEAGAPVML